MKCNIKNVSINYEIIGDGRPIIMLHGYSLDHRVMKGCMEPVFSIGDGFKRIYIDLPGMGRSKSAEWITCSDIMLDIVIEFIEEIIPDENFLIAGESYGGYLSRGVIRKIPEKIDGALLICPVIIADSRKRNVPDHVVLVNDDRLLSQLSPEDAAEFNSMAVVQNPEIYERYINEIQPGIEAGDNTFLESLQEKGYSFSFDVDSMNNKFKKPVLMLLGKQDSCVGYKDAWNILDNFPRATFAVLDMAGHNLQLEQEMLFRSLVNEWLERV